jgi:hypothetical protein
VVCSWSYGDCGTSEPYDFFDGASVGGPFVALEIFDLGSSAGDRSSLGARMSLISSLGESIGLDPKT